MNDLLETFNIFACCMWIACVPAFCAGAGTLLMILAIIAMCTTGVAVILNVAASRNR